MRFLLLFYKFLKVLYNIEVRKRYLSQSNDEGQHHNYFERTEFKVAKFSQKKKAKMRKYRMRRIQRSCRNIIGYTLYTKDFEYVEQVIDKAKINNAMYLLIKDQEGNHSIYKVAEEFNYVKLSQKRVLQNKKAFSNHKNWDYHSTIEFDEDGNIKSVKCGEWYGPYDEVERRKKAMQKRYVVLDFYIVD